MTPTWTVVASVLGSLLVAAIPKIIDYYLGDRIAKRKRDTEAAEAILRQSLEYDAAVRKGQMDFQAALQTENNALRSRLRDYGDDTGVWRRRGGVESAGEPPTRPEADGSVGPTGKT